MAKIERMIFPDGLALESHRRGDRDDEMYRCLLEGRAAVVLDASAV